MSPTPSAGYTGDGDVSGGRSVPDSKGSDTSSDPRRFCYIKASHTFLAGLKCDLLSHFAY